MNRVVLALFLFFGTGSFAQELYKPRNVKMAYANGTRSNSGRPGDQYWQNKGRYTINIKSTPPNRTVYGSEKIVYINNRPQELKQVVLKLYMNMHKPNASRWRDVSADYLTNGITIDSILVNGKSVEYDRGALTIMPLNLPKPLATKDSVELSIAWHYDVSLQSGREGMIDSTSYFLAYFYPRIAVYDDYRGWDVVPFVDYQEFYNDFNDYTVNVQVPKNFLVWATGTLTNSRAVLQPEFAARYERSLKSDEVVRIAAHSDLLSKNVTTDKEYNTWQFTSSHVPDVAIGLSDHYVWDAGSVVVDAKTGRRASMQAAFNDTAKDFHHMVRFGKEILHWLSNSWPGIPYPYEKSVVFQGYAGMEYPMMANDESYEDTLFSKFVAFHELAHTYMPFYMGTNETLYGFMDEGWATAFEYMFNMDKMESKQAIAFFQQFRVKNWANNPLQEQDLPIITPGNHLTGSALGINQYGKPALAYLALKDMLGDELFKKALHEYMNRWAGKHPIPWDFFNIFNNSTGKNLNWFWNSWFFSNNYIDLKLSSVKTVAGTTTVAVENKGGMPVPFDVEVTYTNNSSEILHQTPAVWEKDGKVTTIVFKHKPSVKSVRLEGGIFMDAVPGDNSK